MFCCFLNYKSAIKIEELQIFCFSLIVVKDNKSLTFWAEQVLVGRKGLDTKRKIHFG